MGKGMAGRASAWMLGLSLLVTIAGVVAWLQVRARAAEDSRFPAGTYAYLDDASQLFLGAPAPVRQAGAAAPGLPPGSYPIRISRDAARRAVERGFVPVVLPDGTRYDVRFEREEPAFTGDWTFVGRVDTPFGALASVLTFGPDGVFGTLPAPDGRMFHVTTSHGEATIALAGDLVPAGTTPADPAATDIALPPPPATAAVRSAVAPAHQEGGVEDPERQATTRPAAHPRRAVPAAESVPADEARIDLLGLYTADLVELRGSAAAAETEYANLVAIANQAHADSGTGVRFRIVGLRVTELAPSVANGDALDMITEDALPDGLGVWALRDELRADFVALVRPYPEDSANCGIAWLNGWELHPEWASSTYAYSVSNVAPCTPFALAHELGHNLGSSHDIEAATLWDVQYGAFAFSFGYREGGPGGFATVMAYTQGEPRVGRFSDPVAMDCGAGRRCGVASADNRRSMAYMAAGASQFSEPPGVLRIADAHALEGDDRVTFRLELSSPAPAGGVGWRVATRNGTATAGADFGGTVAEGVIPAGTRLAYVTVPLADDTEVEGDESFELVVESLVGASAARDAATGRILDDDPRVRISGRVRFPEGMEAPTGSLSLQMTGTEGRPDTSRIVTLQPPLFAYDIAVVPGFDVVWRIEMPAPYADFQLELGSLDEDLARDIQAVAAARVRGRILFDPGDPLPETVQVRLEQNGAPGAPVGFVYYDYASPPDYAYDLEAVPGRIGSLRISQPPYPYAPQRIVLPDITGDVDQDIRLRRVPNAYFAWYDDRQRERGGDLNQFFGLWLSAPAPASGVRITIKSRDGTAKAGQDFVAFEETLEYAPGEQYQSVLTTLLGDDVPEEDEWFDVVVSSIEGAWVAEEAYRFTILNDDYPHRAASDVDGDGRSDLAWHSPSSGLLEVWSMGDGAVASVEAHALPGWTGVLALADINGDRAVDALSAMSPEGTLPLWSSYYDPYYRDFTYDTYYEFAAPGADWRLVAHADIDGDGRSQAVWQSAAARRIMWWGADGAWATGSGSRPLPGAQSFAASGDLDGDGNADIVVSDPRTNDAWLWRGSSAGGAQGDQYIGVLLPSPWHLAGAFDIDCDGRDDLVWHDPIGGQLRWWLMEGTKKLGEGEAAVDPVFRLAAVGDYDADGRADLVWRDRGRTGLVMWRGGADGFTPAPLGPHPGGDAMLVGQFIPEVVSSAGGVGGEPHAADLDGDGRTDLGWFNAALGQFDWWRMVGAARAGVRGAVLGDGDALLGTGDFDGDGRDDLLIRNRGSGDVRQLRNTGDGFASAPIDAEVHAGWRLAGIVDIDADRRDDVLWRDDAARRLAWWKMTGDGVDAVGSKSVRHGYHLAAAGDIDGDGRADLLWHALTEGELVAWTGSGDGFVATRVDAWPAGFLLLGAADVDRDGDGDLVWHDQRKREVVTWTMQGPSRKATSRQLIPRPGMVGVATGDFDGDGFGDLAWREDAADGSVAWLWRSTGTGFDEIPIADYPLEPIAVPRMVSGGGGND